MPLCFSGMLLNGETNVTHERPLYLLTLEDKVGREMENLTFLSAKWSGFFQEPSNLRLPVRPASVPSPHRGADWGWGPHVSGLWTLNGDSWNLRCIWRFFFVRVQEGPQSHNPDEGEECCHLLPAWLPLLFRLLIERSSPSESSTLGYMSSFTMSGLPACSADVGVRVIGVSHLGLRYILPDIIWVQI